MGRKPKFIAHLREFAAAHAAAEGLVSAAGLAAVRSHKRHEQPVLAVPA